MPLLVLDTSAEITVALVEATLPDVRVLAARHVAEHRRHAELLAPLVVEVLTEAGVDRTDLSEVVVGTGPAPFTGLRAGLVTARTLAFALGIPVHGVCSLDALAAQAFDLELGEEVVVVTDARRREVYTARYRRSAHDAGDVERVWGPDVVRPADLAAALAAEPAGRPAAAVVGPGAALFPEHLVAAPGGPVALDGAVLARLALVRSARGEALPTEPLYLRRPDVTPSVSAKRATG
ncbi:MAG TPA: tRNA (adenosine(37)-N6)-threonylcarbamoyltransferase complex dimerization subunit type 1 TsaB [Actinotalea sp.]